MQLHPHRGLMWKTIGAVLLTIFIAGYLVPESRVIPVQGASKKDWHPDTFWYEPWGASGVHKGMDIFAARGTPILATTNMVALYRGKLSLGGNVILALGPKWRLHYFAHLAEIKSDAGFLLAKGEAIGTVGDTGDAQGTPPHLHYSIASLVPMPWRMDGATQGHKKAFYLNPVEYLERRSQ